MPHDYAQTIRSFYEAFLRHDQQQMAELLDPQVEWTSAENFLYADRSPYVGVEAVFGLLFGRLASDWDNFVISSNEILGSGDLVIASGRFMGTFKATGTPINAQFAQVFQFQNDKIAKCQMYTDTAQFKESMAVRAVSE